MNQLAAARSARKMRMAATMKERRVYRLMVVLLVFIYRTDEETPNSELCESWGAEGMTEKTRVKAGWSAWDGVALPIRQAACQAQTARPDEKDYANGARQPARGGAGDFCLAPKLYCARSKAGAWERAPIP